MAADAAAYHGARQVWAPILGSALTTVIVFIPVLLLALPVGQLFRDIGIAISVSVLISVVVSVTVIPSLAARLLRGAPDRYTKLVAIPGLDQAASGFARLVVAYARLTVRRSAVGVVVVALLVAGAVGFATRFMPQLDYLPDGNANFAFGRIFTPPGYSMDETLRIAEKMENAARPLWEKEAGGDGPPAIERFFFVAFSGGAFAGASAKDPSRVSELQMVLMRPIFSEPGTGAFVRQASLFGRSVGGSRSIRIDISGPTREAILPVAFRVNERLGELFPRSEGNQVRAFPNLDNGAPQIRITPNLAALATAGVSVRDVTSAVDVFNDGAKRNPDSDSRRTDRPCRGRPGCQQADSSAVGRYPDRDPLRWHSAAVTACKNRDHQCPGTDSPYRRQSGDVASAPANGNPAAGKGR